MAYVIEQKSLNYSDVNLIAQKAIINSRSEIKNEPSRIVVSAMTSIIGPAFLLACSELPTTLQPTIHVPRDIFSLQNLVYLDVLNYDKTKVFVGLGLDTIEVENYARKAGFTHCLLDVANGYLSSVLKKVRELKAKGWIICSGSVHTINGFQDLSIAGCDIIRSGIAPGSVCITADSTGFTRGTISELLDLDKAKSWVRYNPNTALILADGGIRSPADVVKAFSAGADYIMSGRLFVEAKEARMHNPIEVPNFVPPHVYFGMASYYGKLAMGKKVDHIEGRDEVISTKELRPLKEILETIWAGIRSGVSYSGQNSVSNMIGKGVFESKK